MSAPKDKNGKDIEVGDYLAYISPKSTDYSSHMAKVTSIGADGTLSGTRLANSFANLERLSSSAAFDGRQIELLQKALPPTRLGEDAAALLPAKEYIKYTPASGGTRTGRRRRTRKHKRVSRKTRRSRK